MELITRKILNPKLNLTVNASLTESQTYNYNTIIEYIDRAKTYLVSEKLAKRGHRVLILNSKWPDLFIWFIAGAELGLRFVVIDSGTEESKRNLRLYDRVDILLSEFDQIHSYTNTQNKDTFWAESSSILIETLSSGSTGTPKIVEYTQEFLYKLAYRNSQIYDIKNTDKCIHTKTLTHSSTVGVYFLPTLIACENHYYFSGKKHNWVKFIQQEKINVGMVFLNYLEELNKNFNKNIDYKLSLFVVSKLPAGFKEQLTNENLKIISIFGCTESSGPILMSTISSTSVENNFGKVIDDFYLLEIHDCTLVITMPNGEHIFTEDYFTKDQDNNFIFKGRKNEYVINNEVVNLDQLSDVIKTQITDEFDLVADPSYNGIYLRINQSINLNSLNKHILDTLGSSSYLITKQISIPKYRLMTGVKFNADAVRIKCRHLPA